MATCSTFQYELNDWLKFSWQLIPWLYLIWLAVRGVAIESSWVQNSLSKRCIWKVRRSDQWPMYLAFDIPTLGIFQSDKLTPLLL
jgi:hypothetical protein